MNSTKISVLIIDDNIEFATLTKEFLDSKGITVSKIIFKVNDALKEMKNNFYDIIIIDMELDGNVCAGLDIIKNMENRESSRIIVSSGHNEKNLLLGTLGYGILRYLVKPFDMSVLYAHILHITQIRNSISLEVQRQNILSDKQKVILKKISLGYKTNLIAQEMGIAVITVKYHKKYILKKLGTSTINEALCIALKRGLIT